MHLNFIDVLLLHYGQFRVVHHPDYNIAQQSGL